MYLSIKPLAAPPNPPASATSGPNNAPLAAPMPPCMAAAST
ncbi:MULTISPECIES: hypothetical protein [unclassified Bartonella]